MGTLEGRVAIVTGGARGIGRATAHRLATEGAVAFLAGDDASFITGQTIYADGGRRL